jgi:hypothetical protein
VAGSDGVAVTDGHWFEPVSGLTLTLGYAGAYAIGLDGMSAAVMAADRIAVVRPHEPAVIADCADCSGIAATDKYIVTTKKNFRPGEGFDIVLFSRSLTSSRTVPTQRLEERATTAYPAENTDSPITFAADPNKITVGYLSRSGGDRRGPSILAQYTYDGRLMRAIMVDGLLGPSLVSPDGRYLAVGVGGFFGACNTAWDPMIIDLETLQVRKIEPELPEGFRVDPTSSNETWFTLTDLTWQGGLITATGEVHAPRGSETCDPDPQVWRRTFDPATGGLNDLHVTGAEAVRWVGPDCGDVVYVKNYTQQDIQKSALVRKMKGVEEVLGNYNSISLGAPTPSGCSVAK